MRPPCAVCKAPIPVGAETRVVITTPNGDTVYLYGSLECCAVGLESVAKRVRGLLAKKNAKESN